MPTIKDSIERFYKDYQRTDILRNSGTIRQPSKYLSYGRHTIDGDDIEAVTVALKSTHLTQGPRVKHFEEAISNVTESRYAVAVNSGTSALHLACRAAGIGPGDEVITSPNTFVASANCVVYCGGRPIFADIDPHTYNIAPAEIARKITQRTKAVIPVHFAGQSCDMESIAQIVKEAEAKYRHRIVIIEDACHVFGSRYKGTPVGSCRFSDMVVMSFHPVKHITTGEGGAVLTNDPVLDRMVRKLRSHGITNDPKEFVYLQQGFSGSGEGMVNPWYYEQQELGYNYRLTDIQCALGISQIAKLELFQTRRRAIVRQYQSAFQDLPCIQRPFESPDCESIFHLYVLGIDFEKIGRSRAECMVHLNNRGIQTQVHYIPVHTQPFYQQQFGTHWGDCPRAEEYYRRCLSIPLSPLMTDRDVGRVIDEITALVRSHI
ncbi:UDP-4-amino-4,6-dideoxy-N-acetyl-beta-L-altrosamine transaminase [Candidatus Uhrbacteria bacterium]|nr:UDP-4-amino-4,6-dideoxy-N-acetyl-beta-L-altrosamine transaminase [Candidatus Uhrbacteria bacterium]